MEDPPPLPRPPAGPRHAEKRKAIRYPPLNDTDLDGYAEQAEINVDDPLTWMESCKAGRDHRRDSVVCKCGCGFQGRRETGRVITIVAFGRVAVGIGSS